MSFIGNDIVSLNAAENIKSFARPAYISRILHQNEKRTFRHSVSNTAMYWSIKESAYKVFMKQGLKKAFSPELYEVQISGFENEFFHGNVLYKNTTCYFQASVCSDYSIAKCSDNLNSLQATNNIIAFADHLFSKNYNFHIIQNISECLNLETEKICIQKNTDGIPLVYFNQMLLNVDLTISHDGEFFTYAWIRTI